jgi:hypothetical protein
LHATRERLGIFGSIIEENICTKFTGRGPIIAKLHATHKRPRIFGPIFEKDICDKLRAGQQNYMFVSAYSKEIK